MNINEFTALIKALFRNEKGKPYPIDTHMITEIFNIFNKSGVKLILFFRVCLQKKKFALVTREVKSKKRVVFAPRDFFPSPPFLTQLEN